MLCLWSQASPDPQARPVARGVGRPPPQLPIPKILFHPLATFLPNETPPPLGLRSTFPPNKTPPPLGNPGYGPASWNERIHVRGKSRTSIACDQSHPIDARPSHRFGRTCVWGLRVFKKRLTLCLPRRYMWTIIPELTFPVYQRPWYVQPRLCDWSYIRSRATYRKEKGIVSRWSGSS